MKRKDYESLKLRFGGMKDEQIDKIVREIERAVREALSKVHAKRVRNDGNGK
jgi:predicted CopG family antitoxin